MRKILKKTKKFLKKFGPGVITGASDDDPSGIVTYSQTGAMFGLHLLWLSPISCIFAIAVQEMCGRIGMVSGKGLTGIMKQSYPKWVSYPAISLLFIANTINIGADLGAMAAVAQMVLGLPFIFWILCMTALTYWLFALGIIGTGLLGVPVLAGSSSYAISEFFGWETGLGKKLKEAHGFYGVITIATLIGLTINFVGIDPMRALYYSAAINGLMAPPLMLLILFIGNNKKVMGSHTNRRLGNVVGGIATLVMFGIGVVFLKDLFGF